MWLPLLRRPLAPVINDIYWDAFVRDYYLGYDGKTDETEGIYIKCMPHVTPRLNYNASVWGVTPEDNFVGDPGLNESKVRFKFQKLFNTSVM